MQYRLALSMGSAFLAWCVLETEDRKPVRIVGTGVRVFSDGRDIQTGDPLAFGRRSARIMRRNLDRRGSRRDRLMKFMIAAGLMPESEQVRKELEKVDPWELRAKALDGKLSLYHVGRALFHINQRRGFKSMRKAGTADDNASNMKEAIKDLQRSLRATHSRTLGEFLYNRHLQRQSVRARHRMVNNRAEYDFFAGRTMYEQEVNAILEVQKKHHPQLTETVCNELRDIIFFVRPLKPLAIGKCRFESNEPRARAALPLLQK